MSTELIMPKLGMTMKTGTVVEWLKQKGDGVKKGETVAVITSDKLEKDIEAPQDGVLLEIVAEKDAEVEVGRPIGYIGVPGETIPVAVETGGETGMIGTRKESVGETGIPGSANAPIPEIVNRLADLADTFSDTVSGIELKASEAPRPTPAARKLAKDAGIDLAYVIGTGPGGKVTREDVERAIEAKAGATVPIESAVQQTEPPEEPYQIKPVTGIRKVIADKMLSSLQQSAQLTMTLKADITELMDIRQKAKVSIKDETVKLTVTDFIAKAVVMALSEHRYINSTFEDGEIRTYDHIHLGIATAIKTGLVVPVVRNAEGLSLTELSREIKSITERARSNELDTDDMTGSTFTITSLGAYGIEYFTPVLNTPETAILGVGTATAEPVFVGEEIQKRYLLPLSLTFDHRAYDGAPASEFFIKVRYYLEHPFELIF